MISNLRRSLGAKILLLAALNLALLVGIWLWASGVRVPRSFTQVMMQASEGRLQDVARRIAIDLERVQPSEADALIARYEAEYNTRFVLVRNDGTRIAGSNVPIPAEVTQALSGPALQAGERFREEFRFRTPPKFPGGPPPPGHGGPPPGLGGPPISPTGLRMPQTPAHLVNASTMPRFWIVMRTPIRFAGAPEIIPGSLLIAPHRFLGDPLLFPLSSLLWVVLGLSVTIACWWPLLRGLTKSLSRMEHGTSEIAHGRFDTKIGVSRPDEIGRLSSSIEQMAGRLGLMVSGQKRFLGDTAHELRSPIGRMQVALEILDGKVSESERAYVTDLKEDVEALRLLTDELLLYARAELKERGSEQQSVSLRPLVDRVIAKEGHDATIVVDLADDIQVRGDASLLERAIANVIRNAVTYAGTAGPILVVVQTGLGSITLSISDSGPGVAKESLARLFEPFFREDAARNRKTGGTGLGLAIVRSAVEACGGSVSCANREPHGLEVTFNLVRG